MLNILKECFILHKWVWSFHLMSFTFQWFTNLVRAALGLHISRENWIQTSNFLKVFEQLLLLLSCNSELHRFILCCVNRGIRRKVRSDPFTDLRFLHCRPASEDTIAWDAIVWYRIVNTTVKWVHSQPEDRSSPQQFLHSLYTAHCLLSACSRTHCVLTADCFASFPFIMESSRGHCKSITVSCRTNLLLINRLLRLCFMGSCLGSLACKQGIPTWEEWSFVAITTGL